jgi:hypothetical protein
MTDDPFLAASLTGRPGAGLGPGVDPAAAAPSGAASPAPFPAPSRRPPRGGSAARGVLALLALVLVAGAILAAVAHRRPPRAPGDAAVSGVSGSVYETASGRPVLVVRGQVRAGAAPLVSPQLDVELLDGERVVGRARAMAGAVPDPGEAFAADGAAAVERLAAVLAARARPRLEPGEQAPFGAVLAELPAGGAESLAVRVSLVR